MSSVIFATRGQEAAISGREHIRLTGLLRDLSWRDVERHCDPYEEYGPSLLRTAVTLPHWVSKAVGQQFGRNVELLFGGDPGDGGVHLPGRRDVASPLEVAVNTVISTYTYVVALAVRLAAQNQAVAWVHREDRAWLADLIDIGRSTLWPSEIATPATARSKIFADEPSTNGTYGGWQAVIDLLRADRRHDVVLSSSKVDEFPDPVWVLAGQQLRDHPDRATAVRAWWGNATPEQKWEESLAGLRDFTGTDSPERRISPDNLRRPIFGPGTDGQTWQTLAAAWRDQPHP